MLRKGEKQYISDGQDATFMKCLNEIERSYVVLPKALRIRVEKWVEKLVLTGMNITWRKHRNAYARLLLNMIMTRQLSEPFNSMPPDGPLPSFPAHARVMNKDLLGVHESAFWRDLYNRLQDEPNENILSDRSLSFINRSNDQLSALRGIGQEKASSSFASYANPASSNTKNALQHSREITTLNLLVKEQHQKIVLLEQQLQEERIQHELKLQRLQYMQRQQLNQYLELLTKNSIPVPALNQSNASFVLPDHSQVHHSFSSSTSSQLPKQTPITTHHSFSLDNSHLHKNNPLNYGSNVHQSYPSTTPPPFPPFPLNNTTNTTKTTNDNINNNLNHLPAHANIPATLGLHVASKPPTPSNRNLSASPATFLVPTPAPYPTPSAGPEYSTTEVMHDHPAGPSMTMQSYLDSIQHHVTLTDDFLATVSQKHQLPAFGTLPPPPHSYPVHSHDHDYGEDAKEEYEEEQEEEEEEEVYSQSYDLYPTSNHSHTMNSTNYIPQPAGITFPNGNNADDRSHLPEQPNSFFATSHNVPTAYEFVGHDNEPLPQHHNFNESSIYPLPLQPLPQTAATVPSRRPSNASRGYSSSGHSEDERRSTGSIKQQMNGIASFSAASTTSSRGHQEQPQSQYNTEDLSSGDEEFLQYIDKFQVQLDSITSAL